MILHIPHSQLEIKHPETYMTLKHNLAVTDLFTDELFFHEYGDRLIFPYSRLWCDVERYRDDDKEPMALQNQGVVTTSLFGEPFRMIHTKEILDEVYKDYDDFHYQLNKMTAGHLALFDDVTIVDCHSFTPKDGSPDSPDSPDFCLGTNSHTPLGLTNNVKHFLEEKGYSVEINSPYSGSMVPSKFEGASNVYSIMIEVNKKLYLTDKGYGYHKSNSFNKIQETITEVLDIIDNFSPTVIHTQKK